MKLGNSVFHTFKQMAQYAGAAFIGLVVDFTLVIFSKEILGLHYLIAVILGFICGLVVTFFLSGKYVFGQPKNNHKTVFIFFGLIGVVGLAILSLLVWIFTDKLGINYVLSKVIATVAVFMWNFFARKSLYHS